MYELFENDKLEGTTAFVNQVLVSVNYGHYMLETGLIKELYEAHGERWYYVVPINMWFREDTLDET